MKNKVVALMAIIPLILLFTILSLTSAVSLAFDMPVASVAIKTETEDGVLTIDMAEYKNDVYLEVEVLPLNAANRKYTVTCTTVNEDSGGEIVVEDNGLISPRRPGAVKLTVATNDGGYRDSIMVNVVSSKALDLTLAASDILTGESYQVLTGADTDYEVRVDSGRVLFEAFPYPAGVLSDDVVFSYAGAESGYDGGFSVNPVTGAAEARTSGVYIMYVTLPNGIGGDITKSVKITVDKVETPSGITVEGRDDCELAVARTSTSCEVVVECRERPEIIRNSAYSDGEPQIVPVATDVWLLKFAFVEDVKEGSERIILRAGGEDYVLTVIFADYQTTIYGKFPYENKFYQKAGSTLSYFAETTPAPQGGIEYRFELVGEAEIKNTSAATCSVYAPETGEFTLRVYVSVNGGEEYLGAESVVVVCEPYASLLFSENAATWGLSDTLAAGDTAITDGQYTAQPYEFRLGARRAAGGIAALGEDIVVISSDPDVAEAVFADGKLYLEIKSDGRATFAAKWKYADIFREKVGDTLTVDCVKDGVTVSNYADLSKATEDGRKIVLGGDIMLGEELRNADGTLKAGAAEKLAGYVKKLPTTADWTYYRNIGAKQPEINYLIEFTNDVYGNGYFINGDYITQISPVDYPSAAVFKGPLYFVALLSDDSEGTATAAVMAQDNVVFLARRDGITLNNVVLRGCSDESLYEDGKFELKYLNYVGTTLELMADVSVKNCRISNGRTVVRAMGRDGIDLKNTPVDVEAERIDVSIESCILSNAREFILKIGTNRKLYGSYDQNDPYKLSPAFADASGSRYLPRNDGNIDDPYFTQNYVLNHVTLKNSALSTSGLFTIGMETSFAGEMLDGKGTLGPIVAESGWTGLAGTSYPAVLKMEGDVRLYDWKSMDFVDSSTLIETSGNMVSQHEFLRLDIKSMLEQVQKNGKYSDLIAKIDGDSYVHGGIAFYGGGKNYHALDMSGFTGKAFNGYNINLSVLAEGTPEGSALYNQGKLLPLAAGTEDFRFVMYGADSEFGYAYQMKLFADGTAYDFIIPADSFGYRR